MTRRVFALAFLLLAPALPVLAQQPKELQLACAADLQPVMPKLAAAYAEATGVQLVTSFGSSATLAQQLANGAPQDIFLSADTAHPQQLIASGLAIGADPQHPQSPTPYAHGILVLWARKDSPLQPLSTKTIEATLKSPHLTRLAIANPSHAPYGLAAQQALEHLGLYAQLQGKLAIAENIAQTAQFASSGNAQLGLISLTLATSPTLRSTGTFVRIPTDAYSPIQQSAVILKSSHNRAAARAFLDWLTSPEVQQQLKDFGLDPAQ